MFVRIPVRCWSAAAGLALFGVGASPAGSAAGPNGYVYTINNDAQRNAVVALARQDDGTLQEVPGSPFPAGGKGLVAGDIDEQGAIQLHGPHLLAVNPRIGSSAGFRRR